MDFDFGFRKLHIPFELLCHICSYLETASAACAVRLVNRALCTAATPWITDVWESPSILFTKPDPALDPISYDGTDIDPEQRPRWVKKPVTIWTWVKIPEELTLEDPKSSVGNRFLSVLYAPDDAQDDTYERLAFHRYGRKAICSARLDQYSGTFCIITQWDSLASLNSYRSGDEAQSLRNFLDRIAPGCLSTSSSEYTPISARPMRHRPLFEGFHEVRTIYFDPRMSHQQKLELEKTDHLYRQRSMVQAEHHLGRSHWWWLNGLRTYDGSTCVAARFAFFWKTAEIERDHQATETRCEVNTDTDTGEDQPERLVVDIFKEELRNAGVIGTESFHCTFVHGPWRN